MAKTRIEHYIEALKESRTDDAKKGVIMILLAEYSKSIISHVGDTRLVMDWLDEVPK